MKLFERIGKWCKENQEKGSDHYIEREELRGELEEISKDLGVILESKTGKMQNYALERATLIQNIFLQRKLTQATDGLKIATWVLALATAIFTWVEVKNSPSSNEIIQGLQGIAAILILCFILIVLTSLCWKIIKSIYSLTKRLLNKRKNLIE